jgi:hypothetical protein
VRQLIALSLLIVVTLNARGEGDPMRPAGAAATSGAASAPATGLQVVITSPGRKLAVIDGSVVPLGAPVRNAKLAGISDSVAVLQKNGDRDILLMHPNIDKKPAKRGPQ